MKPFPRSHTLIDTSCVAGDHYDKTKVDAWLTEELAGSAERIVERVKGLVEDGSPLRVLDLLTIKKLAAGILEAIKQQETKQC